MSLDNIKQRKIIDPPSGWRYGFPKEFPYFLIDCEEQEREYEFKKWLLEQGYPEFLLEVAVKHSRYWIENAEDTTHSTD